MSVIDVKVPDIGDFDKVPIIEIHVKPGDSIKREDPLITLESDKAAMEVPAADEGRVAEVLVKLGDKVSRGSPILRLEVVSAANDTDASNTVSSPAITAKADDDAIKHALSPDVRPREVAGTALPLAQDFDGVHAGPSVRRLARELNVDLKLINGTGEKGRVTKDDVKRAIAVASGGFGIPEIPAEDFAKFGLIETKPLSRLKRLAGPHLHRAWLNVPHVTHTDEADITELETYRKSLDIAAREKGYRITLLAFVMKACVVALKEYPELNASLAPDKESLILKHYYNFGVAVDTPDGLVVPVIRDVDRKGITEISQELVAVSQKMRDGKIAPADIQGGAFSISSLGGIGGTAFTPIVNAPEVAILGLVKAAMKPQWDGAAFQPRLFLPLCLSYDHRVIDGALAARFTRRLADLLEDVRQLVL